ncbi:(2Fe-2S)-binding protein [Haliea sp. E1-2-M8]|uniref:(2Fe-2S)-binding protein n=1 Tax=Haliea sp. E1-2-M8 TaxID=3064706 RepID=UPI0027218AE6|nr:(2Fe-2S)-binding protein [Haliea sp. E1-2-M8]MDO8862720.1 (2Fe-2S)-binding protein [Haliea sp. E1-2-M8]
MTSKTSPPCDGLSRRNFLRTTGAAGAALGVGIRHAAAHQPGSGVPPDAQPKIELTVNGRLRTLTVEPRTTLVEALRDTLGLTGTKIGCNQGQCGACTVLLNGDRVNSCLILALSANGAEITTIEGLANPDGSLHPMQTAFAEQDAFQCGYCTPGQILSAIACIDEGHAGSADEIREYMSGNLCRCGAYPNIVAAVESVRDSKEG